jgi:hypothetical protein
MAGAAAATGGVTLDAGVVPRRWLWTCAAARDAVPLPMPGAVMRSTAFLAFEVAFPRM